MIGQIKKSLVNLYDTIFSTECKASVGDIMHCRCVIENNQFLSTTRLLDIEDYYSGSDRFKWQNTVSYAAYGSKHREKDGNKAFTNLISSYEKKGYDSSSMFTVDRAIVLLDGNHRMGMNLYHGIHEISLKVLKRSGKNAHGVDWYVRKNIAAPFLSDVLNRYERIQESLIDEGDAFCCVTDEQNVAEAMSFLGNVRKTIEYRQNINKAGEVPEQGYIILFTVDTPDYYIENKKLIARRAITIENVLRERYPKSHITVSKSCLDGYHIYSQLRPFFEI